MQNIVIKLDDKDRAVLEYYMFAFDGLKIKIDQFIHSNFDYNEEHYNRLINTYIEKYADLQKCLYNILVKYNYKNVYINQYQFYINENILTLVGR